MSEDKKECSVCVTGRYDPWSFAYYCEKHNVCIGCGIKRKDLTTTPWGVRLGAFQCKDCEIKERQSGIAERQARGFSHDWEDEIICPYCGYEFRDSWERGEEGNEDCTACEKSFAFERHTQISYSTVTKMENK